MLLDLMLPGVDGIEQMGQVPELADLPVIFISGYGRDEITARQPPRWSVGQIAGGPSCARPQPASKRPRPAGAAGRQIPSLAPDHAAVESPVSSARASGHPPEPRT